MSAAPETGSSEPPAVLELNDTGLQLTGADGRALAPASPGYALFDGSELLTGRAAHRRARLAPRRVESRFWQELDFAGTVARPFPRGMSHADLVYRHLLDLRREIAEPPPVIAVCGAGQSEAQLGLFLGVAAAAGWRVVGLVDGAVAAAVAAADGLEGRALHLDLELHRAVLCELDMGRAPDDSVERRTARVETGVGWARLETAWARFFASRFVRATRFDPLHAADSEQRLYLELGGWLDRLAKADRAELTLEGPRGVERVEVSRQAAVTAVESFYASLGRLVVGAGSARALFLGDRLARLPGLAESLARARGLEVRPLAPATPAAGALAARSFIVSSAEAEAGEASCRVLRLPRRADGAP